jgi:hypothetical protein
MRCVFVFSCGFILILGGACRREASPSPDAAAAVTARHDVPADVPRTHVCYGANGAAVELPLAVACETVGGSERVPDYAPPPRRDTPRRDASR